MINQPYSNKLSQIRTGRNTIDLPANTGRFVQPINVSNKQTPVLFERLCDLPEELIRKTFLNIDHKIMFVLRLVQKKIRDIVFQDLNIILRIDTAKLGQLLRFISNNEHQEFVSKIKGFDFSKISINDDTHREIFFALNAHLYPNFTTLKIGNIDTSVTLSLNRGLTRLALGTIGEGVEFQLSDEFKDITDFSVKEIDTDAICTWPVSMDNLQCLTISTARASGCRNLLALAINLKVLTIQTIDSDCTFISSDPSKVLNMQDLEEYTYILPDSLHRLEKFIIQNLDSNSLLKLSGLFEALAELVVQNICEDATLKLSGSFTSLTDLIIGNVDINAKLELSGSFDSLKNLFFGNVRCDWIELPSLPILEALEFGAVETSITLTDLYCLTRITIGYIGLNGSVTLRGSFNSLVKLRLERLIDGSLTLPSDKFLDYFEDKDQVRERHQIVTHDDKSITLSPFSNQNGLKSVRKQLKNVAYPTIVEL